MSYKKELYKKIIAIALLIMITFADLAIIGTNVISYAIDMTATNSSNILFSAYFIDDKKVQITSIDSYINSNNLKMYLEVAVEKEGYFNGEISFENTSFKINKDLLVENKYIKNVNENSIVLNQINAGTTVKIEVPIQFKNSEQIELESLSKDNKINLTGLYKSSTIDLQIQGETTVKINWKSPEIIEKILEVETITNALYEIEGENKRVVQFLINSKLKEDIYPIKETTIKLNIPDEEVDINIHARATIATNNNNSPIEISDIYEDGKNKIVAKITNKVENGKINWIKNNEDSLVATYIFSADVEWQNIDFLIESLITTYDEKNITTNNSNTIKLENEVDGKITTDIILNEEKIHKGKIYTGENREYTTSTVIDVNYLTMDQIKIEEKESIYYTENSEKQANIQYVQSKINKQECEQLLGIGGRIIIFDQNDSKVSEITINENTVVDENGYININYNSGVKSIKIQTTNPSIEGKLTIHHKKVILDNEYGRADIKELIGIKEQVNVINDEKETLNTTVRKIKLEETKMQAEISINNETLTTEVINKDVIIQVNLLTDGEDKELYNAPELKFTLPEELESVTNPKIAIQNGNGLEIEKSVMEKEDNKNIITVKLKGAQEKYSNEVLKGTLIQLRFDCNINKLSTNIEKKITLEIKNSNTSDILKLDQSLKIINPNSMIIVNNIVGNEEKSELVYKVDGKEKQEIIQSQIINNEQSSISNIRILGMLPTNNSKNNMDITLNGNINIESTNENVKIYYTNNENATNELNNSDNNWQTEFKSDAKKYLIIIEKLEKFQGTKFNIKVNIPNDVKYSSLSKHNFDVVYFDDITSKEKTSSSSKIIFKTEDEIKIKQNLVATVGNDVLINGAEVRAGEIIKYEITLENTGDIKLNDITVEGSVPEGTTQVYWKELKKEAELGIINYMDYEESSDKEATFNNISLKPGEKTTLYYEVKVNENVTDNLDTQCIVKSIYDGNIIKSTISHKLKQADIILDLGNEIRKIGSIRSGYNYEYYLNITNKSNIEKNNLKLFLNSNELLEIVKVNCFYGQDKVSYNGEELQNGINIVKILPSEKISIEIVTKAKDAKDKLEKSEISAKLIDVNSITYRSNRIIEQVETIKLDVKMTTKTNSTKGENKVLPGNTITYKVDIKNIGNTDANSLILKNKIANYLKINSIKSNGNEVKYKEETLFENNKSFTNIIIDIPLKVNESYNLEMVTSVNDIITDKAIEINNKLYLYNDILLKEIDWEKYHIENESSEIVLPGLSDIPGNKEDIPEKIEKFNISGVVWLDENKDGERLQEEKNLSSIKVSLLNISSNNIMTTNTDEKGAYLFRNVEKGNYIVIFEYDTNTYISTIYQGTKISSSKNSDAIQRTIKLNGQEVIAAITDNIKVEKNISNIDLGLIKVEKFDLELNKYVSKISVINSKGTKTYDFNKADLAKVEINAKDLNKSNVIIEYIIEVKNTGEVPANVQSIVDYKPSDLEFSSNINEEWYQSNGYLYNNSLKDIQLNPGETKNIKLILTKQMTDSNTGLVNNTAEISKVYSSLGLEDIDSSPNNKANEDDLGLADVIISVKTGNALKYISLIVNFSVIIMSAIYLITKKLYKFKI